MFKRLVFVFFVLILPLQSVWAAASAYCQHEQGAATQHFGHHAHQHQAADPSNDADNAPTAGFHADCGLCHLGGVAVVTSARDVSTSPPASPMLSPENGVLLSIFLEGPERPKWASAV